MKMYLISDNVDTQIGMRLAGIDGCVAHTAEEIEAEIKKALTFKSANISIRNFPESVEKLRKKWKIKDGGDIYLFFLTALNGKKQMLICSKAYGNGSF